MQATSFMDEASPAADLCELTPPLRVVIAYDDLAAGKRGMRVLANIGKQVGEDIKFEPMPWSFDLLADVDWREVAASEAVQADILIIASSGSGPLPDDVGRWTESAIHRKQGTTAAVVALFGPEENPDGNGSPRWKSIQRATREAGLEFFAPMPRSQFEDVLTEIHRRADMIMPVLVEVLNHPPRPRERAQNPRC